jgi:hypothetical protein
VDGRSNWERRYGSPPTDVHVLLRCAMIWQLHSARRQSVAVKGCPLAVNLVFIPFQANNTRRLKFHQVLFVRVLWAATDRSRARC